MEGLDEDLTMPPKGSTGGSTRKITDLKAPLLHANTKIGGMR